MTDRLVALHIDDGGRPAPSAEIEQERRVAVLDLLEANSFALPPRDGRPAQADDEVTRLRELAMTCYAGLVAECDLPEPWADAFLAASDRDLPLGAALVA